MKLSKKDFAIQKESNVFKILVKQYKFWFIPTWAELTYKADNVEDLFKFESKEDAELFIEEIVSYGV
jgi:hypothetical protein